MEVSVGIWQLSLRASPGRVVEATTREPATGKPALYFPTPGVPALMESERAPRNLVNTRNLSRE